MRKSRRMRKVDMLPAWEEKKCMLLVGRKAAIGITWLWTGE
jgi:hypothetical protein